MIVKVGHLNGKRSKEDGVLAKDALNSVAESIVLVPDLPDIAATWEEGGLCRFDIAVIAVSVSLGQAPWQKVGLQPASLLGGDPEEACLRQVGGLQGREIKCAMRGMFAAGASAVETDKGEVML